MWKPHHRDEFKKNLCLETQLQYASNRGLSYASWKVSEMVVQFDLILDLQVPKTNDKL
jgi:hypothetical protein